MTTYLGQRVLAGLRRQIFLCFSLSIVSSFILGAFYFESDLPHYSTQTTTFAALILIIILTNALTYWKRFRNASTIPHSLVYAITAFYFCFYVLEWGFHAKHLSLSDLQTNMFVTLPFTPLLFFVAFGLFSKNRGLSYCLIFYFTLLAATIFTLSQYPLQAELRRGLVQQFAIANIVYIGLLLVLIKTKENYAAAVIEKSKMESFVLNDDLTGLPNHKALTLNLEQEAARYIRYGIPYGIAVIDLDSFSQFNDTFGSEKGDLIIQEIAKLIKLSINPGNTLGRWGGDEFLCILSGAHPKMLYDFSNEIRQRVQDLRIDSRLSVTVSIGLALVKPQENAQEVLHRAEEALRSAKRRGPNHHVYSAESLPHE